MKIFLCECCKRSQHDGRRDLCTRCLKDWRALQKVYTNAQERFPLLSTSTRSLPEAMAWLLYRVTKNPEDAKLAREIREWVG